MIVCVSHHGHVDAVRVAGIVKRAAGCFCCFGISWSDCERRTEIRSCDSIYSVCVCVSVCVPGGAHQSCGGPGYGGGGAMYMGALGYTPVQ